MVPASDQQITQTDVFFSFAVVDVHRVPAVTVFDVHRVPAVTVADVHRVPAVAADCG